MLSSWTFCLLQGYSIRPASFMSPGLLLTATLSVPSGSQPAFRGTSSNRSSFGHAHHLLVQECEPVWW
ncbi:hypothetical protein V8C35DRAFT_304082 [Trichoderma chlorosporum]